MTTQQDERARLIKGLRDLRDVDFDDLFVKAAALLEGDAKGGEAVGYMPTNGPLYLAGNGGWARVQSTKDDTFTVPVFLRPRQAAQVPLTEAERLRRLLGAALGALQYHTEQTRPIQRTRETIDAIQRELAAHGIGKDQAPVGINGLTEAETAASASVMGLTKKHA